MDLRELRADIETWLNRYLLIGVGQLDMNAIMSSGMKLLHDHRLVLPADLALLFRVLLRLQGLGRGVGTEVRVTELLQPYVKRMMAERFDPRRIARQLSRSVRSWDHFVAGLPDELQAILEQIKTGEVGIDFRVHDADHAVDRLVDGLVTAAAVMAGAAAHLQAGQPDARVLLRARARGRRRRRAHLATARRPTPASTIVGQPGPPSRRIRPTLDQESLIADTSSDAIVLVWSVHQIAPGRTRPTWRVR